MLTRSKLIIFSSIGLVAFLLALTAGYFLIFGGGEENTPPPAKTIALEVWGLFDDSDIYEPIFQAYQKTRPDVNLRYKKFIWDDYEPTLIDALASGRGPDIFMIHNTWLGKHKDKLSPAPSSVRFDFLPSTRSDFGSGNKIYAIALFIDNLGLFYNKDMFAQEGFFNAPKTWDQFTANSKALTRFSPAGELIRAGAALGGDSKTINRATDILLFLMLQNNVKPFELSRGRMGVSWKDDQKKFEAAKDALRFYTDFASPSKSVYTWNEDQDYSIDAFSQGKLAMMLNYSYNIDTIKRKSPYLNFATAPLPQKAALVSVGNYWGLGVSNQSNYKDEAWDFIEFFSRDDQYLSYIKQTGRLSAREKFLTAQKDDPLLKPFVDQASWMVTPFEPDEKKVQDIFDEMMRKVTSGELSHEQALRLAADRLQLLIK